MSSEGEEVGNKSIVLVLIGPPASGKSTFCNHVIQGARRPWTRIAQDIISKGKRGSTAQCINHAVEALKRGENVLIDRCNMTKSHRDELKQLKGPQTEFHAVVFDLPVKLCISRVVKRTEHEGGLQGSKAAAAVHRVLNTKEEPSLSEGFYRITFCHTEADVENCAKMYNELGPTDVLQEGIHGQKEVNVNSKGSLLNYFKKKSDVHNCTLDSKNIQSLEGKEKDTKQIHQSSLSETADMTKKEEILENRISKRDGFQDRKNDSNDKNEDNVIPTLAFPSISTLDFRFDHERAADIIVETVSEFLEKYQTAKFRLVMVDLSQDSDMLSRVHSKAVEKGLDNKRFFTFVGDITALYSQKGLKCNVITNAANWRLKAGGGGINKAIFKAAGPEFEVATKARAKVLNPGKSLVVPLPESSPLKKEGISHVIHVVGPNMNPQRPNCLEGDSVKGCRILRETYLSLLESFISIFSKENDDSSLIPQNLVSSTNEMQSVQDDEVKETKDSGSKNALSVLMQASRKIKRQDLRDPDLNKKSKMASNISENQLKSEAPEHSLDISTETGSVQSLSKTENPSTIGKTVENKNKSRQSGGWAEALYNIAMHPEEHGSTVLKCTEDVVVIHDLYPKAIKHLLVIARMKGLDCLADVRRENLDLLREMHSVGKTLASSFLQEDSSMIFRLGYHSVPSMRQLHLHVISQDFDSFHLKNKKHWNSFTTKFFRDSVDVLEEVENDGQAKIFGEELLSGELRCHRCKSVHPNIPRLKSHISQCKVPFPSSLEIGRHLISYEAAQSD